MFVLSKVVGYLNRKTEKDFWHGEDVEITKHLNLPELTSEEYNLLKKTWPCFKFSNDDVILGRLYKMQNGFDPYYISAGYHWILMTKQLNPHNQVCSLVNKALVDLYFSKIPFPQAYIRCINNILYDKEMNRVSFEEAVQFLMEKKQFVIKPSLNTKQGHGVKKIDLQQTDNVSKEWFKDLFSNATKNFIIQEIVTQHPDVARLNPTSLNCCRITSIYVGGKHACGAMLKIGKKDSIVDNWSSGYFVGITKEGKLNNVGWDKSFNAVTKTDNGIQFGGTNYPCFDTLVSSVASYHKKYLPQCGLIGWDVIIDVNNRPVVIEANLIIPGINAAQLCSGPIFKDVHDELVKQMKH